MAYIFDLPTFSDERGSLTVVENILPFDVKRFYYIYNAVVQRGGHRHKKNMQALICLSGICEVYVNNRGDEEIFSLNAPHKCLILNPEDWHTMGKFSESAILLVFASEFYNSDDYIDEPY